MNNKTKLVRYRFNRDVWLYDISSETLEDEKCLPILKEENIYSKAIRDKLEMLESKFDNLLDKKILNKKEISLTRKEVNLIKKFLAIDSLQQMYFDNNFLSFFKEVEPYAIRYFDLFNTYSTFNPIDRMYLEEMSEYDHTPLSKMNMTEDEKFMYCLKCLLDNDLSSLHKTDCPLEVVAWVATYSESYLGFWDAADSEEFILSDSNKASEFDCCYLNYRGINYEKESYLLANLDDVSMIINYCNLLKMNTIMCQNYNIFSLSDRRAIVCINPFFKLYSEKVPEFGYPEVEHKKPDIWPGTTVHHLKAFEYPKYVFNSSIKSDDDLFIYSPYKLTLEETLGINEKFIDESKQFFGFVDKDKVVKTFACVNLLLAYDEAITANGSGEANAVFARLAQTMTNNRFYELVRKTKTKDNIGDFNPFEIINKTSILSQEGYSTNYYLFEYILKRFEVGPIENVNPFADLHKNKYQLTKFFKEALQTAKKTNKEFISILYNNKL